jgi:alcohol dehydrogenase
LASEWTNPFADALARDAVAVLIRDLPKLVKRPDELELRTAVHYAASAAGVAVSNAQSGLAEALTRTLADRYPLGRGRLAAAVLPFVLEFNFPAARERYLSLGPTLGSASTQHRSSLAERVRQLWDLLGLPRSLAAAGIDGSALRADLPKFAEEVLAVPSAVANPRMASREELVRLVESALDGTPVSF